MNLAYVAGLIVGKYLRIKDKQMLCLYAYEAIRPGRGVKWSQESRDTSELLKAQITWLNKKGVHSEIEPMQTALKELRND